MVLFFKCTNENEQPKLWETNNRLIKLHRGKNV